ERCFKLRHFSSLRKNPDFNLDYVTILNDAKEHDALAVYVLNAFNPAGSILDGIGKYLPKNVLVLINKMDVLPKDFSSQNLIDYVTEKLAKDNIHPQKILLTSSSGINPSNIKEVIKQINVLRNGKSVYFFGAYQVGKSSLINCLLMDYTNSTDNMITTSNYPGTTLDVISIPLDNKSYIYDTPGIYNPKSLISFLEPEVVKYVLPRKTIEPQKFNLKANQSLVISNFVRIDLVSGSKTDILGLISNDVDVEKLKTSKADSYLTSLSNDDSITSKSNKIRSSSDLTITHVVSKKAEKMRIRIVGLGIFDYIGVDQEIDVFAPNGVEVLVENAR
ncbi:MAG: GTPase, partial [Bacilli bacterium]